MSSTPSGFDLYPERSPSPELGPRRQRRWGHYKEDLLPYRRPDAYNVLKTKVASDDGKDGLPPSDIPASDVENADELTYLPPVPRLGTATNFTFDTLLPFEKDLRLVMRRDAQLQTADQKLKFYEDNIDNLKFLRDSVARTFCLIQTLKFDMIWMYSVDLWDEDDAAAARAEHELANVRRQKRVHHRAFKVRHHNGNHALGQYHALSILVQWMEPIIPLLAADVTTAYYNFRDVWTDVAANFQY